MKIILFFAEGPHDIAFIKLALNYGCNLSVCNQQKINSFPAPLNMIFNQLIKEHFYDDWSLDMAHKFLLPDHVLISSDGNYIFLFNTGGMSKYSVVKKLISRIIYQLNHGGTHSDFSINDMKIIFTYDADYRGEKDTIEEVKKNIFPIKVKDCDFDEIDHNSDENILLNLPCPNIYYYIWRDSNGFGTLEDVLLPIYKLSCQNLLENTKKFIDENFSEDFVFDPNKKSKHDIAKKADKNKALITIAGQGKKASKPATAIINDNVLGTKTNFIQSSFVSDFVVFVKDFM